MPALGNFVTSITRDKFIPMVVDNFYEGNALFMRLREKRKTWDSGYRLTVPTEVTARTQLGSYSGADTFGTTQESVRQQFTINPSQYYANLTISGIQSAANRGKEGVVDLMVAEFQSVAKALADTMGTDLYGDGTNNSSKAITGLVAHVDDATNVATYQGLSRNTYTRLRSTLTAQSGALALSNIASDFDAAQVGSDSPTLGLTTPAVFTIIEALYTATSRYLINSNVNERFKLTGAGVEKPGVTGNVGFTGILFRGMPIISDDKCTAANLYLLNENYLDLYEMEPSDFFAKAKKEGFSWTGWKQPTNQDVIVSQLLWYGQLVGTQPRKHSRRTGITS